MCHPPQFPCAGVVTAQEQLESPMVSIQNMQTPELSIVIVNYNAAEYLKPCLDSVIVSNPEISLEVIVVDNGSTDNSTELMGSLYPKIKLIRNKNNFGYAVANNRALNVVKGQYILLLNPDTVLPPNCLRKMLDFLNLHPEIGMIGPKLIRADGTFDHACRRQFPSPLDIYFRLLGLDRLFPRSKLFGHYSLTYLDPNISGEVDCISGAFMLVTRKGLCEVGLLDERFFMYAEDIDWSRRYKLAGWKVYYLAQVEVLHYKRASAIKTAPKMIREFYKSLYLYYDKYYGSITPPLIKLLMRCFLRIRTIVALIFWRMTRRWL
jgi:N-acetylglucosaminyl-diphospho-decaprenol L-rhamnosyltransferase